MGLGSSYESAPLPIKTSWRPPWFQIVWQSTSHNQAKSDELLAEFNKTNLVSTDTWSWQIIWLTGRHSHLVENSLIEYRLFIDHTCPVGLLMRLATYATPHSSPRNHSLGLRALQIKPQI